MSTRLKVTLLMDVEALPADDPQLTGAGGDPCTERDVAGALRGLGHEVRIVTVGDDVARLVADLTSAPQDLVFNLTEQFRYDRRLDKDVAGLLELLGVPFTGSGPDGLMLCRDKALCKEVLGVHQIQCPSFVRFPPGGRVRRPRGMGFPLIVKPLLGDGSEGIAKASVVASDTELLERVRQVHEQWKQGAIAEEFVQGRELYVSLIGDGRWTVFPPREIFFGNSDEDAPRIATTRVKFDEAYRRKWNITYGFAELSDDVARRIADVSRKVCRLLRIRDYARIDLRLTAENKIRILEVNANPDVAHDEDLADSAARAGIDYPQLIDRIVKLAMKRRED